jgi:adenylate kinase
MAARDHLQNKSEKSERGTWFQGAASECSDSARPSGAPWRLILLGAPGVGKGTQAYLLNQRLQACHLSTGDLFRAASKKSDCDLTPAMKSATEHMRRGELVPDATVWEMVRERAACLRCSGGFVLDGFPRTLGQAESLKQLMENERIPLTAVVNYELPLAEIVARLSGRRTCETCKAVFHVTGQPPKVEGVCDRCGGRLFQRDDDRPESVKVRMEAYTRSTAPLIDFYQSSSLLLVVAATGTPEEICDRTITALAARDGADAIAG